MRTLCAGGGGISRDGGFGPGHSRSQRRGGIIRGRRPHPPGDRPPAHLRVCGQRIVAPGRARAVAISTTNISTLISAMADAARPVPPPAERGPRIRAGSAKIIGRTLSSGSNDRLKSIGHADFLGRAPLPDVIESVAIATTPRRVDQESPQRRRFAGPDAPPPDRAARRELFKDEVRAVGAQLGLPREVVPGGSRLPGAGLGVRVVGASARPAGNSCAARMPSCRRR